MQFATGIEIDAPVDDVWQIVGPEFGDVARWASSVRCAEPVEGEVVPSAPMAGRRCETVVGAFTETIIHYDPKARVLQYSADGEEIPFFVRELENEWAVTASESGGARVECTVIVDTKFPFSLMMNWMLKRQMTKVIGQALEELKHFAENGSPHPRKLALQTTESARDAS